jgi:FkbH-like protein
MSAAREPTYRLSRFTQVHEGDGRTLLINGLAEQRLLLERAPAGDALARLAGTTFDLARLGAELGDAQLAPALLDVLVTRRLAVASDDDDDALVRDALAAGRRASGAQPPPAAVRFAGAYRAHVPLDVALLRDAAPQTRLRVLLVGGCFVRFLRDALFDEGLARGLLLDIRHEWPVPSAQLAAVVEAFRPDATVYQPAVQGLLHGLWAELDPAAAGARREAAARVRIALNALVSGALRATNGGLTLVHNVAAPALRPFGKNEFRVEGNTREIVAGINAYIDDLVRPHANGFVVDEERLANDHGARHVLDDEHFPFAHHGGATDAARSEPNQTAQVCRIMAREYLDLIEAYRLNRRTKLAIVDLDGTLWPGIAVEDGFAWTDSDANERWIHAGLHEALRIVAQRGVLLATCSKGDAALTLPLWEREAPSWMLQPGDFVAHRISWQPKDEAIAELIAKLGVDPRAVAFFDDNPVERELVRRRFPTMRIPDCGVAGFRRSLLDSASFDPPEVSREARERAATTRLALARDEAAEQYASQADFLASLDVRLTVEPMADRDRVRVAELLSRTTQFNTTGVSFEELARGGSASFYVLRARDRFVADYGLVGVCAVDGSAIRALAVSCRVLALDAALPFLLAVLRLESPAAGPWLGVLVETERNTPARDVFARAGFTRRGDGVWISPDQRALPALEGFPHTIELREPASATP